MLDTQTLHEGLLRLPAPVAAVPVSPFDPYDLQVLLDPYPHYEELRALGRILWLERYGVFALTHYDEVKSVLANPATYGSSAGAGLSNFHTEKPWRPPSLLLEADPPEHDRTRQQMVRVLNPGSVRALRPRFEQEAGAMVDHLAATGEGDAIKLLCEAFPLKVFPDAVGLREDGRENLLPYGDMVFNGFGPCNERFRKSLEPMARVAGWIGEACQRKNLKPGRLGAQIYQGADRGDLSEDEAGMLVRSLLSAGLDTTVFTLSLALYNFAIHPGQWALLRDDPSLARNAVEEVLRYDTTFHTFYRTTNHATELNAVPFAPHQKILVMTASANRDETVWPDANRFDITRKTTGHLGFGHGIHACVGQMLARLEAEIVLQAMAQRIETIELAGQPVQHMNNTVRGYKYLPVRVKAK